MIHYKYTNNDIIQFTNFIKKEYLNKIKTKFDVKLDKTNATTVICTDQADTKKTITLTAGVYYWRVIAKDNNGNHSESGVYKFTVQ